VCRAPGTENARIATDEAAERKLGGFFVGVVET
jgi:hypothetical protein